MAYRTEVRRFTDTLAVQTDQLDRLLILHKAQAPQASVSAGRAKVDFFRARKAAPAVDQELVADFALELLRAHKLGTPSPNMRDTVRQLRAHAADMGGRQGKMLSAIADLGEAIWALPRMWDNRDPVAKGYPEYDPSQPRDNAGRFASGGGGGGSSERRGMSVRRAELFDAYRLKYGYFPPKGMPNQRIEMWVTDKAPAGANVTHEVRGILAQSRADETWADTFKRTTGDILRGVYNWVSSPVIMDTLITIAMYALATKAMPAIAAQTGLKSTLNRAVTIVNRRTPSSSKELLDVIDNLVSMTPRGAAARARRGFFG